MMRCTALFFCILAAGMNFSFGQKTSFRISTETLFVDGNNSLYKDLNAGDTLYFLAGTKDYLYIKNIQGENGNPVIFINWGGPVIIDTEGYSGISIQNCRYFKLTGSGDPGITYGFQVKRVAKGGGLGIGGKSSDFEVDHLSIENCSIGGIYAKTDPDCELTATRDKFIQYNTVIHDNYIANTGNEGMYIGSTKYFGQNVNCGGKDTLLMPSLLEGVKIYNNIIKYSGWDGIQVSSASTNCKVFNNTVLYDSQASYVNQMSGIILGGGSKCDCYNNFILGGNGNGIENHGLGGNRIFNNLIVNAGKSYMPNDLSKMKFGIYVSDVSVIADSSFYIYHNTIISPKSDGIRFSSIKSKKNIIASNLIVNPGNFEYYENGNTRFKGNDSYVMFPYTETEAMLKTNYFSRNIDDIGFIAVNPRISSDFKLTKGSPLIDAADDKYSPNFDFFGTKRPYGLHSDIGATEFDNTTLANQLTTTKKNNCFQINNPVNDCLEITNYTGNVQNISIRIFDLSGNQSFELLNTPIDNNKLIINTSKLPEGIYIYILESKECNETGKFIKL